MRLYRTALPTALMATALLTGCTASDAAGGPAASSSSTPTTPSSVALTARGVGEFAVDGDGSGVEAALTKSLGAPTRIEEVGKSCEIIGNGYPPERRLRWGGLTVILSHEDGALKVVGWQVDPRPLPAPVTLPYDVTTATPVEEALTRIPGASGVWDETFESFSITTASDPELRWAGDKDDGTGPVTGITDAYRPCE